MILSSLIFIAINVKNDVDTYHPSLVNSLAEVKSTSQISAEEQVKQWE